MKVLELHNVSVQIGTFSLLREACLQLEHNEVVAIVGPNGAGKSTLLKTISGDLHTHQGDILFHGAPLRALPPNERAKKIAVLPQHSELNFPFSVTEVVALGRIPHATGLNSDTAIVRDAMKALDITHLRERLYPQLSGGEKQRVQLARVLAQLWQTDTSERRLLLLDEPTAHIDIGHQQQLMSEIKTFAQQNVAILLVLHDINLAIQYADRLIAMHSGNIIASGRPENIITQPLIDQLFGNRVKVLTHPNDHKPIVLPGLL
ncbi:heme ABC transporter ATP-binding protein [Teredinibacter purpureus]|uniref:heme ABC transporter ATP-binding protein n=1 Tax=Teredinibacter purpureus TaxID=2731756 RepID=UPI0005F7F9B4|nr:heme ABC transporter ATP-binding protein [Teredinibacter purpureus]